MLVGLNVCSMFNLKKHLILVRSIRMSEVWQDRGQKDFRKKRMQDWNKQPSQHIPGNVTKSAGWKFASLDFKENSILALTQTRPTPETTQQQLLEGLLVCAVLFLHQ